MAVIIINESTTAYSINGITYLKNFQSLVSGDYIRIVNVYDSKLEILSNTIYSDFTVDTVSYGSAALLQTALVEILFNRTGATSSGDMLKADYGGSDSTTVTNSDKLGGELPAFYIADPTTVITWEALVALGSRDANQKYDITGSADPTKDYGKVTLTSADTFNWVNTNNSNEIIIII